MDPAERLIIMDEDFGETCPYCCIEMRATGHPSGVCNGWTCPECGHTEPEMGSYALAGRPPVSLACHCRNCKSFEKRKGVVPLGY